MKTSIGARMGTIYWPVCWCVSNNDKYLAISPYSGIVDDNYESIVL